eukprot:6186326-Pleurochrysis_carterae.AAC.7
MARDRPIGVRRAIRIISKQIAVSIMAPAASWAEHELVVQPALLVRVAHVAHRAGVFKWLHAMPAETPGTALIYLVEPICMLKKAQKCTEAPVIERTTSQAICRCPYSVPPHPRAAIKLS